MSHQNIGTEEDKIQVALSQASFPYRSNWKRRLYMTPFIKRLLPGGAADTIAAAGAAYIRDFEDVLKRQPGGFTITLDQEVESEDLLKSVIDTHEKLEMWRKSVEERGKACLITLSVCATLAATALGNVDKANFEGRGEAAALFGMIIVPLLWFAQAARLTIHVMGPQPSFLACDAKILNPEVTHISCWNVEENIGQYVISCRYLSTACIVRTAYLEGALFSIRNAIYTVIALGSLYAAVRFGFLDLALAWLFSLL